MPYHITTRVLHGGIEAEKKGARIPTVVRWLGRLARYRDGWSEASSAALRPKERGLDASERVVCGSWGRRYEVEVFEETRPDARCGTCNGWGRIEAHRDRGARCALRAEKHRTGKQKFPVEWCSVGKGQAGVHVVAWCPNCRDQHTTQSNLCMKRRRSLPPPSRREEGAPAASPPLEGEEMGGWKRRNP